MNDKMSRIALVLVALAASAFLAKDCVSEDTADTGNGVPEGADTSGTTIDPTRGSEALPRDATSGLSKPTAAPEPMDRRDVGPPLDAGTSVELQIHYRAGTETKYRIENATTQRNMSNDLTVFMRRWDDITTKVVHVGDDGSARVRLSMDAVRLQAYYPNGLIIEFDSRNPDDTLLDNPTAALVIKPMLALIGLPIEFQLAANGAPVEVEGLQTWRDAWEEAVERESPGDSREISTPLSRDTVMLEWRELLFPPVAGAPLEAGDERGVELLRDTLQKAYVKYAGPMKATHDDGTVFRVRVVATPTMMRRQGEARSAQEAAIADVHVQADKDAYYAAWRFNRDVGRLEDAEIETRYRLWVSWPVGKDASGKESFQPVFLQMERQTRVELLSE